MGLFSIFKKNKEKKQEAKKYEVGLEKTRKGALISAKIAIVGS